MTPTTPTSWLVARDCRGLVFQGEIFQGVDEIDASATPSPRGHPWRVAGVVRRRGCRVALSLPRWWGGHTSNNTLAPIDMQTQATTGALIPAIETAKPAKPAKGEAAKGEAAKPAKGEAAGGKGNALPIASKAQIRERFARDASALAAVLIALGAIERIQRHPSTGQVTCHRVYARLSDLTRNRSALSGEDRKMAGAAIDALAAVGVLRGEFVALELFRESVTVRSRVTAGKHHKS